MITSSVNSARPVFGKSVTNKPVFGQGPRSDWQATPARLAEFLSRDDQERLRATLEYMAKQREKSGRDSDN